MVKNKEKESPFSGKKGVQGFHTESVGQSIPGGLSARKRNCSNVWISIGFLCMGCQKTVSSF